MASYLDTIPESAAENVVRLLSARTRLRNWQSSVRKDTVLTLLNLDGTFAEFTRRTFRAIIAPPSRLDIETGDQTGVVNSGTSAAAATLVLALGPNIEKLYLGSCTIGTSSALDIAMNCTSLRHLDLFGTPVQCVQTAVPSFLALRGPTLEILEFRTFGNMTGEVVAAISLHCRALRRLCLGFRHFLAPTTPIWQNLGGHLRHIEIGSAFPVLELDIIGVECSSITHSPLLRQL